MSSLSDNLKNLNAKGCQCLYSTDLGPTWQIRVFPASSLRTLVVEHTSSGRRFNIRHFGNHYARHTRVNSYPQTLEAILENITVERGDDTGIRLSVALKTFDAERLVLLGRDDIYVDRIQPYLERVAAAPQSQRAAIITEMYTVLQEPKFMAFAERNQKFKDTMIAKAEELRLLHYLEYPELSRHLAIALDAYGQKPKCLPSKNEVVMANFPKLPANLFIRAEMPTKPHSTPYEGILNGTTVWQKYAYKSEESLAEFLERFSTNNWLKWPLDGPCATEIPDILHHLYSGSQNLYEALLHWKEETKALLVCKTVEEYKNPAATQDAIVLANFSKLPANLYVYAKTPMFCNPHYGILNGEVVWNPLLNKSQTVSEFLAKFSADNFVSWPMGGLRPTELVKILHYLYSGSENLYQALLHWAPDTKDLLKCKSIEPTEEDTVLANFATLPDGIQVRIQAYNCDRCDWGILYPSRQTIFRQQVRREIPLKSFFDQFIDDNEGLEMFETIPSTLQEFLLNMFINKTDRSLYQYLKTWTKEDESLLLLQTPREMIDSFYTFVPWGEPLEKETADSCDCYRCKTELELKMDLALLQGQMKAALKRIQLLEERKD